MSGTGTDEESGNDGGDNRGMSVRATLFGTVVAGVVMGCAMVL